MLSWRKNLGGSWWFGGRIRSLKPPHICTDDDKAFIIITVVSARHISSPPGLMYSQSASEMHKAL